MKTLDEVIKAIEVCRDSYVAGKIIKSDALHYLKEYKDAGISLDKLRQNIEKYAEARVEMEDIATDYIALKQYWAEQQANNPLSWDELKQMEGKPVWMEWLLGCWKDAKKWVIVGKVFDNYLTFTATDIVQGYAGTLYECHIGEVWQAYRKERKE